MTCRGRLLPRFALAILATRSGSLADALAPTRAIGVPTVSGDQAESSLRAPIVSRGTLRARRQTVTGPSDSPPVGDGDDAFLTERFRQVTADDPRPSLHRLCQWPRDRAVGDAEDLDLAVDGAAQPRSPDSAPWGAIGTEAQEKASGIEHDMTMRGTCAECKQKLGCHRGSSRLPWHGPSRGGPWQCAAAI